MGDERPGSCARRAKGYKLCGEFDEGEMFVAKVLTPWLVGEEKLSIVGQSPVRKGVENLVAGKAKFTGDFNFPDLLVGLILRSPFPHARIRGIDTAQAEKLPGVRAGTGLYDAPVTSQSISMVSVGSPLSFQTCRW